MLWKKPINLSENKEYQIFSQICQGDEIFQKMRQICIETKDRAVMRSIRGVKNWNINFKTTIYPSSENQDPLETNITKFWQTLILEPISQSLLVS